MYIKRVLLVKYETEYEISAKVGGANMQINILMNLKRIELDDDGGGWSLYSWEGHPLDVDGNLIPRWSPR